MISGSLDNITQMEQLTDFDALQKVQLVGLMPYISILAYGEDPSPYVDITLNQWDGYNLKQTLIPFTICNATHFEKYGLNPIEEETKFAASGQ